MKISHSELEACIQQPRAWLREKLNTATHPFKFGYNRVLLFSIFHYHKTKQASLGRQYLQDAIQRRQFKDFGRIDEIELAFESYVNWCESQHLAVADSHILIRRNWGFLTLIGEIARVDVMPECYRAVLLGDYQPNWRLQLRMPLIQIAISDMFARPVNEVVVGVQHLDGSGLQYRRYSVASLRQAERRFSAVSSILARYEKRIKKTPSP